ncbi:hypothetical protein TNCV_3714371 [Trichonephila clavipes]|nr:hypothetical protein TNCV_3714371 [Trichonephila clavipes]
MHMQQIDFILIDEIGKSCSHGIIYVSNVFTSATSNVDWYGPSKSRDNDSSAEPWSERLESAEEPDETIPIYA